MTIRNDQPMLVTLQSTDRQELERDMGYTIGIATPDSLVDWLCHPEHGSFVLLNQLPLDSRQLNQLLANEFDWLRP